jgi:hypothetical protein
LQSATLDPGSTRTHGLSFRFSPRTSACRFVKLAIMLQLTRRAPVRWFKCHLLSTTEVPKYLRVSHASLTRLRTTLFLILLGNAYVCSSSLLPASFNHSLSTPFALILPSQVLLSSSSSPTGSLNKTSEVHRPLRCSRRRSFLQTR